MPSLHISRKRVQSLAGSDGSVIPAGTVTASSSPPNVVSTSVDPVTNKVTVTGLVAGSANVTYEATGYQYNVQTFSVTPLPQIVVTDGPEE